MKNEKYKLRKNLTKTYRETIFYRIEALKDFFEVEKSILFNLTLDIVSLILFNRVYL